MARKLLFLNALLLLGVVLLGLRLIYGWQSFQEEHSPSKLFSQAQSQGAATLPEYEPRGLDDPGFVDYSIVVERNLFSEDRQPPLPAEEQQAAKVAPEIPREPLLHGVARIGDYTLAQITKFDARSPQGQRMQVTEGDQLHGWTVAEITTDYMTLRWEDQELEIPKTAAPAQQAAARGASGGGGVRIITIGSRASAVETTTSSATEGEEQSGLQVASVGQQQGARGGTPSRGAQQQQRGQGLTGNQSLRGNNSSSSRFQNNRRQSSRPIQQGRPPR